MGDGGTYSSARSSLWRPVWVVAAAVLAAAGAGCADGGTEPEGPTALRLQALWGDGEKGLPGEMLLYPVMVLVTDARSRPVAGVPVRFEPAEGCGSAGPSAGVSDTYGRATTRWRLGSGSVRAQQLRVTIDEGVEGGGAQIVLEATAIRPDEADRIEVRGALGPLKGIVLAQVEDGLFSVLYAKASADTVVLLPPLTQQATDLLVFSYGNRPVLQQVTWTPGVDSARVILAPPVLVDVDMIVHAGVFDEMRPLIEADLRRMEDGWIESAMGLRLGRVSWMDGTGGGPWHVYNTGVCDQPPGSTIQISFMDTVDGWSNAGYGCASGYVLLGSRWYTFPYLLAHEVGHTFALQHTAHGLMAPMSPGAYVRAGEVFRAHFDRRSALNTIFGSQPVADRRLCLGGPESLCLPEDFDFIEGVAASPENSLFREVP